MDFSKYRPSRKAYERNAGGFEATHCVIYVGLDKQRRDLTPDILFCGSENECWIFIHQHQGQSVDWAMKHEGYSIQRVPFANNPHPPSNEEAIFGALSRASALTRMHYRLLSNKTRLELIDLLVQIDPNGMWTDEDSLLNEQPPLTKDEAIHYVLKIYGREKAT